MELRKKNKPEDRLNHLIEKVQIDLARILFSHIAHRSLGEITINPIELTVNCLPDGLTLNTIISSCLPKDQKKTGIITSQEIVNFFALCMVKAVYLLRTKAALQLSSQENQIATSIGVIEGNGGFDIKRSIAMVYSHFNTLLPAEYRATKKPASVQVSHQPYQPESTPARDTARSINNGLEFRKSKPNRRRTKNRVMGKSGHSLKQTIIPTIGKKSQRFK